MPAPEKRLYMNVHPYRHKKTHQTIGWVAKLSVDGVRRTVGGIHETQQLAAATAARVLKVPLQDLRLQQPQPRRRHGAAGVSSVVQQSSNPRAGRKRKGLQPSSRPSSGAAGVSSIVRQSRLAGRGRALAGRGRASSHHPGLAVEQQVSAVLSSSPGILLLRRGFTNMSITGSRTTGEKVAGLHKFLLMAFKELWEESIRRSSWLLQQRPVS